MRVCILTLCLSLILSSTLFAEGLVGHWSWKTSVDSCDGDFDFYNSGTFHMWSACLDSVNSCYVITEDAGTWQKISKGLYGICVGDFCGTIIQTGNVAFLNDSVEIVALTKKVSIDALKSDFYQYQCQQ